MTIKEAVQLAHTKLSNMLVPASALEQIGQPLTEALSLLNASVRALETADGSEEAEAKGDDE